MLKNLRTELIDVLDNPEITEVVDDSWVEEWRDETPSIYWQWTPEEKVQEEIDTPGIRIEDEWESRPKSEQDLLSLMRTKAKEKQDTIRLGRTIHLGDTNSEAKRLPDSAPVFARKILREIGSKDFKHLIETPLKELYEEDSLLDKGNLSILEDFTAKKKILFIFRTVFLMSDIRPEELYTKEVLEKYRRFKIRCCKCGEEIPVKIKIKEGTSNKINWHKVEPFFCDPCKREEQKVVKEEKNLDDPVEHLKWIDEEHTGYPLLKQKYREVLRKEIGMEQPSSSFNERQMRNAIEKLFPNQEIIPRASPHEITELDVYLPEANLAFEYQGRQHSEPVEHFGGEDNFEKVKKNDEKKRKACREHGIELIEVWYDEAPSSQKEWKALMVEKIQNSGKPSKTSD